MTTRTAQGKAERKRLFDALGTNADDDHVPPQVSRQMCCGRGDLNTVPTISPAAIAPTLARTSRPSLVQNV